MALSRAATAGVGMLGGVVGLTVFLMSRGLPDESHTAAAQTDGWMKTARAEVGVQRSRLNKVVAEDSAFLSPRPEVKAAQAAYDGQLAAIDKVGKQIEAEIAPILKADRYGDRFLLYLKLSSIEASLKSSAPGISQRLADVYRVRNYKRDHKTLMKGALASQRSAAVGISDSTLLAVANKGQVDYPEMSEIIQKRMDTLTAKAALATSASAALDAAAKAQPIKYVEAGQIAERVQRDSKAVTNGIATLRSDIASLGKSTDKILVDMKKENGNCAHKYRFIEGGLAQHSSWVPVACTEYAAHEQHLGMAVYSKPEGTFESEAVTVAHPPGYSYIGNTRYGRWDNRSGGRYWMWYGQYSLTRDLLWGVGGYRPIRNRSWSSYRSSVKARKPYYGATKQYGTGGTLTKTKYKSSSFLTKRRATFAASKFKGSGSGKYRSSGSGSGNTRSGSTYRSNRYRSSSFGGSGK
ncbi:MAG: hypothetical protein ACI9U2_001984 [Bradymonadia bacterium]|jgi:hypothetical protein